MSKKEERFIKRGKRFAFVMSLLCLVNIIILIGRNQSYAFFRRTVSSKRIIEIHTPSEFPSKDLTSTLKKSITSHTTDGVNLTVEDEDGTIYLSGTNDQINFNYVWYSGKLWRITAINSDNTIKMITQDEITAINWGSNTTYQGSWIYQWLNEDFLDTLENQENIIVQDAKWNATTTTSNSKPAETTIVEGKVGLLNAYEYYQAYKNASASTNYLNIGYYWWLITPHSSSYVRNVYYNGDLSLSLSNSGSPLGVRPSINLKSDIKIGGGEGTKENPYRIEGDKVVVKVNDKLNSRVSGEYVNYDGKKYRIVGIENGVTKLTSVDYVRGADGAVMTKNFSSGTTNYGDVGTSTDYWAGYLNDTTASGWYGSISETYRKMLVKGTYYLGQYSYGVSYKNTICSASNTAERTKSCSKTSSTWEGYVGLPRVGEMFSAMLGNGYEDTATYIWLITPYSSSDVRNVSNYGYLSDYSPGPAAIGVRPSINLNSNVLITGGEGTEQKPYEIKYVAPPGVDIIKKTMGQTGGIIGVTTSNTKVTQEGSNIREYRYSGLGAKNYVTFNDEKWRIIGIFKDEAGQEHMKIVRTEVLQYADFPATYTANGTLFYIRYNSISYNYAYWDNPTSGSYYNNWGEAGLMYWLNSLGTTDGYLKTLSTTAQGMIEETKWYLGNNKYGSSGDTTITAYTSERDASNIHSGNPATWTGKIALMYPSDMGFSADSSYWSSTKLYSYNSDAAATSWLQKEANHSDYEWFLSPSSSGYSSVAIWTSNGYVYTNSTNSRSGGTRPALYLKSDVQIAGGQGSINSPYTLQ